MSKRTWTEEVDEAIYLFNCGENYQSYKHFGCHPCCDEQGGEGYRFLVWAPHARAVYVTGDFNQWELASMELIDQTGVWIFYSTKAQEHDCYKYVIEDYNGHREYKIDPFAARFETPPKDAAVIYNVPKKDWKDGVWQRNKRHRSNLEKPLNIYEVHSTSWKRHPDGRAYSLPELAVTLLPYVKEMGYTHVELMPLMDHPLDASWGYQITGYFAVAGRIGTIGELQDFVEQAHRMGIGVIMDWVPGHFCRNQNALAYFDGTPTFEYADVDRADNRGWGALNFDLGKTQVQSFLISSAVFWLEECHIDGIRVDAVSNMLYLDFDNPNWRPNIYGDRVNLEGVAFIQKLNSVVFARQPAALMIAEESTSWDGVTRPVHNGGLGFLYKWNMGWMNDTLKYIEEDPIFRSHHYRLLTFSFMYTFNENYILPFSHDEVVHGKNSMLGKIKGDRYRQFATLRTLQAYMMAHPGKKLNFMGYELGQFLEWRFYAELEWIDLTREFNYEFQHFVKTLNHFYREHPALYERDHDPTAFQVLEADNAQDSIIAFIRKGKKARDFVVTVTNFIPVEQPTYRIGVPYAGQYQIVLNTEAAEFGGTWQKTNDELRSEPIPHQNCSYSVECVVPSLGTIYIVPKRIYGVNKEEKVDEK